MLEQKTMHRLTVFSGILSIIALAIAWIVIIASIHGTPWFKLTQNALSDMGREGAPARNIFNNGLIAVGLLGVSLTLLTCSSTKSRFGCFSGGVFLTAMINLVLIGVFPEGTKPHFIVSVEFFFFKWLGALFYSIALLREGLKITGTTGILLFVIFLISLPTVKWPSTGVLEVTSIGLFTLWALITVPSIIIYSGRREPKA